MKQKNVVSVLAQIQALEPLLDVSFGQFNVVMVTSRAGNPVYRVSRDGIVLLRTGTAYRAAQFVNARWSQEYGERKFVIFN